MPIEIKELHIKVKIEDDKGVQVNNTLSVASLERFKSQVISECTSRVLEKIKEREER